MTQAIYFSHRCGPVRSHLTLKGRSVPLVKEVKYVGLISDNRATCRCHIDSIFTKALRTFIRIYSLLKSEQRLIKRQIEINTS